MIRVCFVVRVGKMRTEVGGKQASKVAAALNDI